MKVFYILLFVITGLVLSYLYLKSKPSYRFINENEVISYIKQTNAILIDVRTLSEWKQQHNPRSIHIPIDRLVFDLENIIPDKKQPIIFCCKRSIRSQAAAIIAKRLKYTNVFYTGYCNSI